MQEYKINNYALVIILCFFYFFIFIIRQPPNISDRDDAAVISAEKLLEFENPYRYTTQLGNPITTGISNILIAMPFVLVLGDIRLLTFIFWSLLTITLYKNEFL